MFLLKLLNKSPLIAGYAGPLRVKSVGKDRNRTVVHHCRRIDPDRF